MKKTFIILASMLYMGIQGAQAQGLFRGLRAHLGGKTETPTEKNDTTSTTQKDSDKGGLGALGSFLTGIMGIDDGNANRWVGTWTYKQPAIIFESDNMLTNVGAMAAGKTVESKLQSYLNKIGFTAGKVTLTLHEDSTGVLVFAKKNIPFQWSVEGSDMTIKLGNKTVASELLGNRTQLGKLTTFTINCKQTMNELQLSFKADKLMQFINKVLAVTGKTSNNSMLSTIAGLANKVDGMYIGLTLEK